MVKNIFLSFHYTEDSSRVKRFRSIMERGYVNKIRPNDWESVKNDPSSIKKWIDNQLEKADYTIVLIGSQTATRDWVKYEIMRSWELGLGLIGINVHNFKDEKGIVGSKGEEPFTPAIGRAGKLVPTYNPMPSNPYREISSNIDTWLQKSLTTKQICRDDYMMQEPHIRNFG